MSIFDNNFANSITAQNINTQQAAAQAFTQQALAQNAKNIANSKMRVLHKQTVTKRKLGEYPLRQTKTEKIADMQERMYDKGYYGNIPYQQAVTGAVNPAMVDAFAKQRHDEMQNRPAITRFLDKHRSDIRKGVNNVLMSNAITALPTMWKTSANYLNVPTDLVLTELRINEKPIITNEKTRFFPQQERFWQEAADRKQTKYWNTPEERDLYFAINPDDTIKAGWYGKVFPKLGITQSDYKKYFNEHYKGLASTNFLDALGITDGGAYPGIAAAQQTLGSANMYYTKDGVIIDDTWDFNPSEANKTISFTNPSQIIRDIAGKYGSKDNAPAIIRTKAKIPYKYRE